MTKSTSNTPSLKYRPDIDGLRALAIISVIVFHSFPSVLPSGFVGVDIFFVISGYLITRIIYESQLNGVFSLQSFFIHRARRILPALILVVATSLLVGRFVLLSEEFKSLGKHVVAGATYTSNLLLITESGYFDFASDSKPLLHLWSLGVEEQFYVIWPVLMLLAWRKRLSTQNLTVTLLFISFVFNVMTIDLWPIATFYSPLSRVWELLIGAVLAVVKLKGRRIERTASNNLLGWSGFILLTWSLIETSAGIPMPGWWALFPTTGAACLIAAGPDSWVNQRILTNRVLVSVGLISYPLYLWHWPLLTFARIVEGQQPSEVIRLIVVILSGALAWTTYLLVEKPIRRLNGLPMAMTLVATLSFVGLLGYAVYTHSGFPKEGLLKSESAARFTNDNGWRDGGWNFQPQCPELIGREFHFYCIVHDLLRPPTALLVGDSNANQFYPGLSNLYARQQENLLNLGQAGCPPLFGVDVVMKEGDLHCKVVAEKALQYAIDQPAVKTVILSMLGVGYSIGRRSVQETSTNFVKLSKVGRPDLDSNLAVLESAMRDTFSRLTATRKKVIFVISAPMLDFEPSSCVDVRPWRITPTRLKEPCAISQAQVDVLSQPYRSMVFKVGKDYPSVEIIDVPKELCDGTYCWAIKEGHLIYRDTEHLSIYGSRYVADRLSAFILPKE